MYDELKAELRRFAAERDWEQFHQPRNLLLALVGEVGELAELFQWRSDDDIRNLATGAADSRLADELADVAIYLVRLADVLGIDLGDAVNSKMASNAQRYPVNRSRGSARKYTEFDA